MRLPSLAPAALLIVYAAFAVPQQTASAPASDGLDLLKRVAQHYADAKSYALAATEEISSSSELDRTWQKTILAAAEAPDGRYYYEGHAGMGSTIKASDGHSAWKYHVEENRYTVKTVEQSAKDSGPIPMSEMALWRAQDLKGQLARLARTLNSASLYSNETLTVDGKAVPCFVVRIRDRDENRPHPNAHFERTIWIDKQNETVLKVEETYDLQHVSGPASGTRSQVTTTVYTKTVLDGPVPDSVFTFVPPAPAHLVARFPDPMESPGMLFSMTGDTVPSLKFKGADGKTVAVESFRGKPVIIDFWATTCAPCVAEMPKLAEIYKEGKDRGLVLLSIDQDEEAAKAADFLAKKGYSWPNFHDGDGEIEKLMGSTGGIPRTVLIDANGQIVYDGTGGDENRLRTHLAQLGPEFKDLAPKALQPAPCVAAK